MTYLDDLAGAVTSTWTAHWQQYVAWMTDFCQGRVGTVISALREWQTRLGLPVADNAPRQIVAKTLTYLANNDPRMNYSQYRQQGQPVTSCLVESLIKEINHRVKRAEQFWNRLIATEGEAILQTVASLLRDGEPLTKHILNRPACPYCRRSTAANLAAT